MRRLDLRGPDSRGLCVDVDGAVLGAEFTLVHRAQNEYFALDRAIAAPLQEFLFGASPEPDWLFGQCHRIAKALSRGEIAIAQIYGLRMPIGELDDEQLEKLARAAVFVRAGFNPNEPRVPKGNPQGGEWTTDDGAGDIGNPDEIVSPSSSDAAGANANPLLIDVAYQGFYHDQVVRELAAHWVSQGATVLTSVSLTTLGGVTARVDILAIDPSGDGLSVFEVKTGVDPQYTGPQRIVYPMSQIGYHVYSTESKIATLGFASGERLPPMRFFTVYKENPDSPYRWIEHPDPLLP